ncbi:MAG: glycosyltransferase family 2 protein [Endomicrobiia bacterium]
MNYFLLCAYNEEKNILSLIKNIKDSFKYEHKIVVVDDGSTDNTVYELKKFHSGDIFIISHKKNLGLGYALKTGFLYIIENLNLHPKDIIITMDADNTHPAELANSMVEKIIDGYDIIIASRYQPQSKQYKVAFYRKLISFIARIVLRTIFPYKNLKDYTSGYRAYSAKIIKQLYQKFKENFIEEKNFVVQIELLTKLFLFSPKIYEIPFCLRYDRKYGKSKLKIVKNILSYVKFLIKKFLKRYSL